MSEGKFAGARNAIQELCFRLSPTNFEIAVLIVAYATGRSESDQKTRERSSLIATFAGDHHRSVIICA